jgi:signal transduction histidine kinase/ActR/RegA family two-component response regulator
MAESPSTIDWAQQVNATRTRMLFSHVPLAAPISGGFALLLTTLVYHLHPSAVTPWVWLWAITTFLLECGHGLHGWRYLKSRNRQAPHWRNRQLLFLVGVGSCWAASIWIMPLPDHYELRATLIGSVIGVAACGAFLFTADRLFARICFLPILISMGVFCASLMDVRGMFGLASVLGFMSIFWVSANRSHRRIGELLRLRFESEHLAQLRASALDEANALAKTKDMFLATMSHEMRTPLHGILGLSRMLREDVGTSGANQRLDLLQSAGTHLLGIINDVLDFSRLRAGRLVLRQGPVDVHALVEEVTALAHANVRGKPVKVTCDIRLPSPYWINTDGHRLRQVLHNLMGNAVKFTQHGHVSLLARRDKTGSKDSLCFEVQDTGVGIPEDEIKRIFEPFHQVDGKYERRVTGTGLGLSISTQICQVMGGTLECKSKVGTGSTFRCMLPVQTMAPPVCTDEHDSVWSQAGDIHVLLVEDNPVNTLVAKAELERMGMQVSTLENGRQAVDWLLLNPVDMVLMDCHMPEMNGFEATRRIRERETRLNITPVPIVALTASTNQADQELSMASGMNDFVSKPFSSVELQQIMKKHLGQRSLVADAPVSC